MPLQEPSTFDGSFGCNLSSGDNTSRFLTKDGDTIISQYQFFGDGSSGYFKGDGELQLELFAVDMDGNFRTYASVTTPIGVFSQKITVADILITSGEGTPEGNLVGPVGSIYTDKNGAAGAVLWVKETGSDENGWVAK